MHEARPSALIVALSARALAQAAARAGYDVLTVDLFADADTVALGGRCETVRADRLGITPESLASTLARLRDCRPDVIVYGSGFDGRPGMIDTLAMAFPDARCAGAAASAVAACKDPVRLGAVLAAAAIRYPAVATVGQVKPEGWLMKAAGASGGAHVRTARAGEAIDAGWYAQQRVDGPSMSALFVADGHRATLLGLCGHWRGFDLSPGSFAHSGLVTLSATHTLASRIDAIGRHCTQAFDLRGLWGVDFIVGVGGEPIVVDVNPRPTAAMELLGGPCNLFKAHLEQSAPVAARLAESAASRASLVCRATAPLEIAVDLAWPDWVADRPVAGSRVERDEPLCTVFSSGPSPDVAIARANERRLRIEEMLRGCRRH